jgi:hypothetical protein
VIPPPLIGRLGAVLAIPLTDNFYQDLVARSPRLDDRCITSSGWLRRKGPSDLRHVLRANGIEIGLRICTAATHPPLPDTHPPGALILRLPPGYELLDEVLARIRALPATP